MILDLMGDAVHSKRGFEVINGVEYWKVALVTLVIISIDTVVAIVAKNLGTVLGITGAIGSSTIMLILPSIMYLRYLVKAKKTNNVLLVALSLCILVLGVVFGTLGTIATIQQS